MQLPAAARLDGFTLDGSWRGLTVRPVAADARAVFSRVAFWAAAGVLLVACASQERPSSQPSEAAPPPAGMTAPPIAGAAGMPQTAGVAGVPATSGTSAPPPAAGRSGASGSAAGQGGAPVDAGPVGEAGSSAQPDAAAAGGGGSGGVPPAAACSVADQLEPGSSTGMIQHQGRNRSFTVYVPADLPADTAVPLVLDFHGNGGSATQQQSSSGWRQKADAEHFVVAYPQGIGNAWNVGNCCGQPLNEMVDDVGFAKALVAHLSSQRCIDPSRVFATGLSNGAGLTHRLACEAADVFAAIAAASADLVTDPCTPARPISELSVRGLRDTLVAYEGGNTGSTGWYSPGAKGTLELWKKIDGCTGMVQTTHEYCETYSSCKDGVEVTLCSLPNTGHILYDNPVGFDVPEVSWEMFLRQPRR